MNRTREARDRLIDLAMDEVLGDRHPPDLRRRVLASSRQRCREALARAGEGARFGDRCGAELASFGRRWASVAIVFLAVSLVTSIFWQSDAWRDRRSGQDTGFRLVIPQDATAFVALLDKVQSARLRVSPRSHALPSITIAAKDAKSIAARFKANAEPAKFTCPSGPVGEEHELEFQLDGNRVLLVRVYGLSDHTPPCIELVVADVVAQKMSEKLEDALRPWCRELRRAFPRRLRGRDQLLHFSQQSTARQVSALALENVKTADLGLLAEMKNLSALDLVGATRVPGASLIRIPNRDRLRVLSLDATQLGPSGDWLGELRRLDTLRVTSRGWHDVRSMTGRGCSLCHQTTDSKLEHRSGTFAGLAKTRRIRFLDVLGMRLDSAFCKRLGELPFLESVNLSGCDLSELDLTVFKRLPALRHLDLHGCRGVDAKDLESLSSLRGLQTLNLRGLDREAGSRLRSVMPGCDVRF